MAKRNRFSIRNELPKSLTLNIEPEGALFPLACGDEVVVSEEFREIPLTLKFSNSAKGETVVSIWPGDGDVQVAKDGEDVLDLISTLEQRAKEGEQAIAAGKGANWRSQRSDV